MVSCSCGVPLSLLPPPSPTGDLCPLDWEYWNKYLWKSSSSPDPRAVRALFPGPGIPGVSHLCFPEFLPQEFLCFSIVDETRRKGSSWLQRQQENTEFWGNETHSPREGKLGEQEAHGGALRKPCVLESKENLGLGCLDETEQGERGF